MDQEENTYKWRNKKKYERITNSLEPTFFRVLLTKSPALLLLPIHADTGKEKHETTSKR